MYAVGLMSGTSLDGIDAALVQIEGSGYESKVKLLHFITMPFSPQLKKEIEQALSFEHSNVQLICSLNFKLGYAFADAVKKVCQEARFSLEQIDVIGSHGQTIYHHLMLREVQRCLHSKLESRLLLPMKPKRR